MNKLKLLLENKRGIKKIIVRHNEYAPQRKSENFLILSMDLSVEELELNCFTIGSEIDLYLSNFIKDNKTIKNITFSYCVFEDGHKAYLHSIKHNITIESLNFRWCHFNEFF